jgi:predicted unusual protein kinase regulating ubiquinone biosynthesis (AarF/ABC1/UbiB family)
MREVIAPYSRLGVPTVHHELSSRRLLVMDEIQGGPLSNAPAGAARREAARQLLEAFYRQVLTEGFFHADPHPGNLLWTGERIYLLDLGMVGELAPDQRELLILLLLAFARNDPAFLAETVLLLAGEEGRSDLDLESLEREFADFVAEFQVSSLRDVRIGPMLDGMIRIASRHRIRLPAALALAAKAFGQVQLAIAELDPSLDPFRVVGTFLVRNVRERLLRQADPQRLYYEGQKLKVRTVRLIEAIERATGARPGPKLQVDFIGAAPIESAIRRAGRLLSLAALAAACVVGAATTAASDIASWVPIVFGSVAAVFAVWLVLELRRQR